MYKMNNDVSSLKTILTEVQERLDSFSRTISDVTEQKLDPASKSNNLILFTDLEKNKEKVLENLQTRQQSLQNALNKFDVVLQETMREGKCRLCSGCETFELHNKESRCDTCQSVSFWL